VDALGRPQLPTQSDVTSQLDWPLTTMFRLAFTASTKLRPGIRHAHTQHLPRYVPQQSSTSFLARRCMSSSTESGTSHCPSCSAALPTPLPACPQCFFITMPQQDTTLYDIMGLSFSSNPFEVNPAQLKNRFRELQRIIHPDKWSNKGGVRSVYVWRVLSC
jgi:hypothetical protein